MSQNIVIFENSGEIDLRTVSTFGCSVKETKNPIGFFGTGLKYALAVLLRTGHKITLQSGAEQIAVTSRKDSIRGREFDFVFVGDQPAGFTTELGKTWEVWMAYRELFCNAKDEPDGKTFESDFSPPSEIGKTRVIVSGEPITGTHQKRQDFILEGEPLFKVGTLEIHARPTTGFFYRGIRVMDFQRPALFTYNQTERVELTEDRTVKDPYQTSYDIAREIVKYAEKPMLEKVLLASLDNIESQFDFDWPSITPSRDFFSTVAELQRSSLTKINPSAVRMWREKGQGFIDPRRIKPTAVQLATLEKAISFCEKSGFMLRDEYPIMLVESLGENGVLAMADMIGNQIFLTERVFQLAGTKGVAHALIEEYLHLKFKFKDQSRELQNFLLAKVVSLAEEITGEPL